MTAPDITAGFAEPVLDAQSVFRRMMDAFARPGSPATLGGCVAPPPMIGQAAAALLLALADHETPVWFEDAAVAGASAGWLTFQTGAPVADRPGEASFALLAEPTDIAAWSAFALGESAYPDRSATLILPVAALSGGASLRLSGPGIETETLIAPRGLPSGFVAARAANHALFPLGLDLVLTAGAEAVALPRTTAIREA